MDVMKETAEATLMVAEKTGEATLQTQKTFTWVLGSAIVGIILALLTDPQVLALMKANPKVALWIPVINVIAVFGKKLFDEFK